MSDDYTVHLEAIAVLAKEAFSDEDMDCDDEGTVCHWCGAEMKWKGTTHHPECLYLRYKKLMEVSE